MRMRTWLPGGSVLSKEILGRFAREQVVHSVISRYVAGRSLVEIGTRNGDGMVCFARAARSAMAIEMDPVYCKLLEKRAKASGVGHPTFTIMCDNYQKQALDADVFTWWQQLPDLRNEEVLQHLRGQQVAGSIRADAEAILLFEVGFPDDMRSYHVLSNLTRWSKTVKFDEMALCTTKLRRQKWFHQRAHGSFRIIGVRIADVQWRG